MMYEADCHLVSSVVDLYVFPIYVDVLVCVIKDCGRSRIAGVAGHVISNHQDDLTTTVISISIIVMVLAVGLEIQPPLRGEF